MSDDPVSFRAPKDNVDAEEGPVMQVLGHRRVYDYLLEPSAADYTPTRTITQVGKNPTHVDHFATTWALQDAGGRRLHIENLSNVNKRMMCNTLVSDKEDRFPIYGNNSLGSLQDLLIGGVRQRYFHVRQRDYVLAVDKALTVVGEVSRCSDGRLVVQHPPWPTRAMVITESTFETEIKNRERSVQVLKGFSHAAFVLGGAVMVGRVIYRQIMRRREEQARQNARALLLERERKREAAREKAMAEGLDPEAADRLAEKALCDAESDGMDRIARTCVVCLEDPTNVVFKKCGHLCVCSGCVHRLKNRCPLCRRSSGTLRVYHV